MVESPHSQEIQTWPIDRLVFYARNGNFGRLEKAFLTYLGAILTVPIIQTDWPESVTPGSVLCSRSGGFLVQVQFGGALTLGSCVLLLAGMAFGDAISVNGTCEVGNCTTPDTLSAGQSIRFLPL